MNVCFIKRIKADGYIHICFVLNSVAWW